jgi:penicillin amidase
LRKVLKFVLLTLAVLLLLGIVIGGAWFTVSVRRAWPQEDGRIEAAGLSAPVEVVRDRWGIPHLYAANEHDLFFAQGYVHAQDRLWQMEFNRSVGSGRLSALFGPGPLDTDRYLRTIGLRRAAERDLALLSADTRAILDAYAQGVNAFVAANRGALPVEFKILRVNPEPWTAVDSLTWSRMMGFTLSLNSQFELGRSRLTEVLGAEATRRLIPPYPADAPVIVPDFTLPAMPQASATEDSLASFTLPGFLPGFFPTSRRDQIWGSNAWVVHGSRTATGKPLLANDTHLGLAMPSVWYENGLHGGRFDCVGFSFPGMPLVIIGQNRRIAWGITNLNADVQDVYLEKLDDPQHPRRAQFMGRWEELRREREEIPVKGGQPVTLEVLSTRHGPLIHQALMPPPERRAQPMSLRWASYDGNRLLDAISRLDRAGNWQEFRQAMALWDSPSLNIVYADVDGNIAYQATARTPIRASGHDGTVPVPGWNGTYEWKGFIPFEQMPYVLNPSSGFVATANHKVVSDSYPYPLTQDWAPADRARRINALLAADRSVTREDMEKFQLDVVGAQSTRRFIGYLAAVRPADEVERKALERARSWDLRFDTDSVGAAINAVWGDRLVPAIFDELDRDPRLEFAKGVVYGQPDMIDELMKHPNDPWFDDKRTPQVETRDDIVRRSFSAAVAKLRQELGDDVDEWRWGRLHTISFAHQPLGMSGIAPLEWIFNSKTMEVPGSGETVDSLGGTDPADPFRVGFGVSQRFIADLSDLGRSVAVNSTGESALPFHRHREDQVPMWARGEYHPVLATREAARAQAESVLTLSPAGRK